MPQITIEVSDELHQQLAQVGENPADWFSQHLPELLLQLTKTADGVPEELLPAIASAANLPPVYAEVLDFLVTRPTHNEILAFKASEQAQVRLRSLLDKNREGTLTDAENAELDSCEQLEHLMILLKVRAQAAVTQ